MSSASQERLEEIFHGALDVPPEGRAAYLDAACAGDVGLRLRVEALIRADEQAGRVFASTARQAAGEHSLGQLLALDDVEPARIGDRIGSFQIERLIGSGGMGAVYEAIQDEPRRKVALKLLKAGISSRSILRRFRYEAEFLARLQHPFVAHVYEAGVHQEGTLRVPYFAMEYVPEAKTLTSYVDSMDLSPRDRLDLFARVCDAVHYAHQKGVIHRDLKPTNILVDGAGQPKIIDFGVARASDAGANGATALTGEGLLVGTLAYMSPEQCLGDADEIDTRSDVYALGVVLYEVLCGALPYDLTQASLSQALKVIREGAPRRPSSLRKILRGDVETIVLKALEKDRARRYASAADLADDLRRYLRNEPIAARPASGLYHFRKLVSRHKAPSLLLALLMLTLAIFAVASVVQSRQVARERDTAQKVSGFLENVLQGADPELLGHEVTGKQLVDRAVARIDADLAGEPEVESRVREIAGTAYRNLGKYEDAERELRKALERERQTVGDSPRAARLLSAVAMTLLDRKLPAAAEPLAREALDLGRASARGSKLPLTSLLSNHAATLRGVGKQKDAETHLLEAIQLERASESDDNSGLADALRGLGELYEELSEFEKSEACLREAVDILQAGPFAGRAKGARTLSNLASVQMRRNKPVEAGQNWEKALKDLSTYLGGDHPTIAAVLSNLGLVYSMRGDLDQAEAAYRRALEIRKTWPGLSPITAVPTMEKLAATLAAKNDWSGADALYREAVELLDRTSGPTSYEAASLRVLWAFHLRAGAKTSEAAAEIERALPVLEQSLPRSRFELASALLGLGKVLVEQGKAADAEPRLRDALKRRSELLDKSHWQVAYARVALAECLTSLKRFEEAEAHLVAALPLLVSSLNEKHPRVVDALKALVKLYEAWGKPEKAAEYRVRIK